MRADWVRWILCGVCALGSTVLLAKPPKTLAINQMQSSSSVSQSQSTPLPFSREDLQWLHRITYGLNTATLLNYQQLGRAAFLAKELAGGSDEMLSPALQAALQNPLANNPGEPGNKPLAQVMREIDQENRRINALTDEEQKQTARRALNETGNQAVYEASRRLWLRALYSPFQLQEQMVGFWLNHFSVFQYKDKLRWLVGDFEQRAIRPYALGNFRDLLRATLKHPAMLLYLDNAQSANGKVNENYARELMELHTLGVEGGYNQQDVQELARILTGVGVNSQDNNPRLKPEWQTLYIREDAFEFNPARHDFGTKQFLGKTIEGQGWVEVEQALDVLLKHPATAKFISRKLCQYFVSDEPSMSLQERVARSFVNNQGEIRPVLQTLFTSPEFIASLGQKFKDPQHYVLSVMRLAYDSKTVINLKPVNNWLNALGQPVFGRLTPDGYSMLARDWSSSGQLAKRFEIAKAIGAGNNGLFDTNDGSVPPMMGFPMLSNRLFYATYDRALSPTTQAALNAAASQVEWNAYLLSSPEFMYR